MTIRRRLAEEWDSKDILSSLWRILASPWATIALLLTLGLLVLAGMLLPQRPTLALSDPLAQSAWRVSVEARYGNSFAWMVGLGFFDLYRSMWLRAILGLLAFNLVLTLVDLVRPFSPRQLDGNQAPSKWRTLSSLLVFAGMLVILAGVLLAERSTWWETNVPVCPGQIRPVGHESGLAFRADGIMPHYDLASGQVRGGQTELTFLRAAGEVGQEVLYDHTPSFFGGLTFYQLSTEPVLLIRASDATGRGLPLQTPETGASELSEVTLHFRDEDASRFIVVLGVPGEPSALQFEQKGNERYVLVPAKDLSLRLSFVLPAPGEVEPTFLMEAFRGAETIPFQQARLTKSASIVINNDVFTFEPQRHAVIQFGRDYSPFLVLTGGLLMLAGFLFSSWQIAVDWLSQYRPVLALDAESPKSGHPIAGSSTGHVFGLVLMEGVLSGALILILLACTKDWAIAQTADRPLSLPRAWWNLLYIVWILACASLLKAGIRGLVSLVASMWKGTNHGGVGSGALLTGLPMLTLLLLLGALSGTYTQGVYWEWAVTDSRRLVTWLLYAAFWCCYMLLGWRGRRIHALAVLGLVPTLLMLIIPGR
jgi:hypothetical protein